MQNTFLHLQMFPMTTCLHCSSHLVSQRTISGDHGTMKDDKFLPRKLKL